MYEQKGVAPTFLKCRPEPGSKSLFAGDQFSRGNYNMPFHILKALKSPNRRALHLTSLVGWWNAYLADTITYIRFNGAIQIVCEFSSDGDAIRHEEDVD
jgi:hypothetical protein